VSAGTTAFVSTWIIGAGVGVGLYAFSKSQFPRVSEKTERIRKLILIGLVPCCGMNILLALIYYGVFFGKARFDRSRDNRAERLLSQSMGSGAAPGANPFGSSLGPSSTPQGENPFGSPPPSASAPEGENPFGSSSGAGGSPAGTGEPNPFGEPPGSRSHSSENPFED
jgi:hypothetical protein